VETSDLTLQHKIPRNLFLVLFDPVLKLTASFAEQKRSSEKSSIIAVSKLILSIPTVSVVISNVKSHSNAKDTEFKHEKLYISCTVSFHSRPQDPLNFNGTVATYFQCILFSVARIIVIDELDKSQLFYIRKKYF
jgi:hypothetical protein